MRSPRPSRPTRPAGPSRPSGNERGQASIMIGMIMLTFILFFAFVVNTGMLVNAKINLQNAADLAAFAGASVQARQLTQISYLNYEMRRQYKKFLFRYYVMGNMAQRPFPRNAAGGGPPLWSPDGQTNYGAPVTCIVFNPNDNFCQLAALPKIEIPPSNPLDAINETLIEQLRQIERIRQDNCLNIGFTNTTTLRLWLWNTDPDVTNLQQAIPDPKLVRSINTIRSISSGLGLVPRELILRQRIETLKDYVNQPAAKNVSVDTVQGLGGADPASAERTIEAFLSAYYTLGNHTFNASDITLDELLPGQLLALKDIKARFDAYATNFQLRGGATANGDNPGDCTPVVEADTVQTPFPLGVYKDASVLTYYAVRLRATAKVMFSPFGDMELKAYAAAQPFGSRIGPVLEDKDFVRDANLALQPPQGSNDFNFTKLIPNLPIREDENGAAPGTGWDTQQALNAYYQKFGGGAGQGNIQQADIDRAYKAAMAPNPYEGRRYNIINDAGADPFVRNFDTNQIFAFWAPLFSANKQGDPQALIQDMLENLMGDAGPGAADLKRAIKQELSNYVGKLRSNQGESIGGIREGFNIARLENPLTELGTDQPISLSGGLALTDPARIKTSWNDVLNGDFKRQGRVGYSVKFVSFASLTSRKNKTNDIDVWTNGIEADVESDADLPLIRH